jgi:triosephosphate isomerase
MYQLIVNLKTYEESSGKKAEKILKAAQNLKAEAKKKKVRIVLACQDLDLRTLTSQKSIEIYAQHIDPLSPGAHTGHHIPALLKQAKAKGSLISHSEHQLSIKEITEVLKVAKKEKLETCVCARDAKRVGEVAKLKPDFVAVEPAALIGGDISISTAKPDLIKKSVKAAGKVPLLIGAGVKNAEDVRIGIELGAKGVLLASGVAKTKNPEKVMRELLKGF